MPFRRLRERLRALEALVERTAAAQEQAGADARRIQDELAVLAAGRQQTHEQVVALRAELGAVAQRLAEADERFAAADARVLANLEVLVDGERRSRERVVALRAASDYEAAWTDPEPLVSIAIPTYVHWQTLVERAIPSALAQTYGNVEVVVVGDAAGEEVVSAMAAIDDPRVRFENLSIRGPYPEDQRERWYVAGSGPMNRAMELARGRWIAFLNDDDAMRPDHVEVLLEEARRSRAEVVYGKLETRTPGDEGPHAGEVLGAFPPSNHSFGWQLAIHHAGLRFFEYELAAALSGEPGDWNRARRMMRAGVRFSQVDRVIFDYYPSTLWREAH